MSTFFFIFTFQFSNFKTFVWTHTEYFHKRLGEKGIINVGVPF